MAIGRNITQDDILLFLLTCDDNDIRKYVKERAELYKIYDQMVVLPEQLSAHDVVTITTIGETSARLGTIQIRSIVDMQGRDISPGFTDECLINGTNLNSYRFFRDKTFIFFKHFQAYDFIKSLGMANVRYL